MTEKSGKDNSFKEKTIRLFEGIKLKNSILALCGSILLAFTLYNIHSVSHITEGGALGLMLLLEHWFNISPSITEFIVSAICYTFGWKMLGKNFIIYSVISTGGFSLTYKILEFFPPIYPKIAEMPLTSTILGGLLVGISCGICVKVGGAPTGDDAMAMGLSKKIHIPIQYIYLTSDLSVLLLSLTYIPFKRIAYSLLTVLISGKVIGIIQDYDKKKKIKKPKKDTETELK